MSFLEKLCQIMTHHRWRSLEGWTEKLENDPDDYKPEYYWRCNLCGCGFWNYFDEIKDRDKRQLKK